MFYKRIEPNASLNNIPLAKLEDFTNTLNIDGFWKELAGRILTRDRSKYRFNTIDIETLSREKNPAKSMLKSWATDGAKIKDLIDLCSQLNLNTLVEFFKDFVIFEEKKRNIYSNEIPYKTLLIWTNNFNNTNLIGIGGFSNVYKAYDREANIQYAIKKLNPSIDNLSLDQLKNELLIISNCKHRNLMEIVGYSIEGNIFCLVYDFASNGSLDNQIFYNGKNFNCKKRLNLINDIASGIAYLHSKQFIHRDIKPGNILLDDNFVAKLCDYGFARYINSPSMETISVSIAGTDMYIAPEVIYDGKLSGKTDVYSFGIVILEIVTGLRALDNDRIEPIITDHIRITCKYHPNQIKDPRIDDWDIEILNELIKMSNQCLSEKDSNRPSMDDILKTIAIYL